VHLGAELDEADGVGLDAFHRHEERLQQLSLRPSEYVQRQVRFTPYPTEDVGWITDQVGPDVLLFNTDYPHVEGGRRPFERFEKSLGDRPDDIRRRFYADNFVDLMGSAVAPPGRARRQPPVPVADRRSGAGQSPRLRRDRPHPGACGVRR
jgi:predicted TIM-barrel fold metal-dependent hydrolase